MEQSWKMMKKLVRLEMKSISTYVFSRKRIYVRKRWKKTLGKNTLREHFIESSIAIEIKFKACIPSDKHMVVSTVRYSAGIIEWMKEEVKEMDQKTRNIIT